jgi:hypothetical protein
MSEGLPEKRATKKGAIGERGEEHTGDHPAKWLEVAEGNNFGLEGDRVSRLAPPEGATEIHLQVKPESD